MNDNNPKRRSHYLFCWITLFVALSVSFGIILGGCVKRSTKETALPEIFWPKPPEVRRIEFVNAVSAPQDLNIHPNIVKQLVNYIGGKTVAPIVAPYGIARDKQGRLYIVDTFLKRIHVFDAQENHYYSFPKDKNLLISPVGIAIDNDGIIYVTDSKKGVVYLFKDLGKKAVTAIGKNIFKRPTGIAVNLKTSELLVVDTLDSKVLRFDLSDWNLKGSFGINGSAESEFHFPTNIFVTPSGGIIVSDSLNFRVQVFSAQGSYLFQFGRMGDVPGSFSRPKGVAADSDGNIYVVDALFDNVQVFDKKGHLLMVFGDHGTGYGEFWLPTDIYIDENDLIYVSDSSNRRVQIFRYLKEEVTK